MVRHPGQIRQPTRVDVTIGDMLFTKGYADGHDNNCLIHCLQQAVAVHFSCVANIPWIRAELQRRYPLAHEFAVTDRNFLDLRNHWEAIIELLLLSARAQGSYIPDAIRPASFRIISVQEGRQVIGDEVGTGHYRLYILNESFLHFVPLIRRR